MTIVILLLLCAIGAGIAAAQLRFHAKKPWFPLHVFGGILINVAAAALVYSGQTAYALIKGEGPAVETFRFDVLSALLVLVISWLSVGFIALWMAHRNQIHSRWEIWLDLAQEVSVAPLLYLIGHLATCSTPIHQPLPSDAHVANVAALDATVPDPRPELDAGVAISKATAQMFLFHARTPMSNNDLVFDMFVTMSGAGKLLVRRSTEPPQRQNAIIVPSEGPVEHFLMTDRPVWFKTSQTTTTTAYVPVSASTWRCQVDQRASGQVTLRSTPNLTVTDAGVVISRADAAIITRKDAATPQTAAVDAGVPAAQLRSGDAGADADDSGDKKVWVTFTDRGFRIPLAKEATRIRVVLDLRSYSLGGDGMSCLTLFRSGVVRPRIIFACEEPDSDRPLIAKDDGQCLWDIELDNSENATDNWFLAL